MNEQIDYSRRDFLRRAIAAPVGVAAGIALVPTFIGLNLGTEAVTGMRAGNASEYEDDRERCATVPEDQICPPPPLLSIKELYGDMGAPIIEEAVFRDIPSSVLDYCSSDKRPAYLTSEHHLRLTRKEVIVGAISSLIFGAVHNHTSKGFDTNTIPASQTLCGGALWFLQRKFGFWSNLTAHATINTSASLIKQVFPTKGLKK